MATDLIQIDQDHPLPEAIERAAAHLRRGDIVAIPTEALYVLVADPLNLHAVGRVFAAKGREIHRSLPMLISGTFMAEELAKDLSTRFYVLARHFWPGPLTMIVPSSAKVPLKVTGNTGRLAVRQSRSRVAQAVARSSAVSKGVLSGGVHPCSSASGGCEPPVPDERGELLDREEDQPTPDQEGK